MEKATLKTLKCPNCGAALKAQNNTEAIECVYCGNTVVPVTETATAHESTAGFSGVLKVEGMRTPASALAYVEQFFDEYDWEAFSYAQTLSIAEIDKLAASLKVSSADDKNTWFVCFMAAAVPFVHKVESCKNILSSVIEEYKENNLDAYSKFDAYKRILTMIAVHKGDIVSNLKKIAANAAKYGASSAEISGLHADIEKIENATALSSYDTIESIPEIQTFISQKNAKIVEALAARGINAEDEYARAKTLIAEKKYVDALNILLSLNGYSDTQKIIEEVDKYFLISDVLEIEGVLYFFKKESDESSTYSLYPTENGMISKKPIIKGIGKIITNYANILYYLDSAGKLKRYNLVTGVKEAIGEKHFSKKNLYVYNRTVYLLGTKKADESAAQKELVALNLASGTLKAITDDVHTLEFESGNKLVYTNSAYANCVLNLDTLESVELGEHAGTVKGFVGNYVIYTQIAPNRYNKDLYVMELVPGAEEQLIEHNIYDFCGVVADKLFYYIGNSNNLTLININCDGTGRKQWPLFTSKILFEQAGWMYFIRKAGYNSILCKSHLDGSSFKVIAADIEEFIEIKNGYLYYINDDSALVKVRMDGSNLQKLCEDVESVLSVKEDKIIFISVDDRITTTNPATQQTTQKIVKSIYAVDFSGSGKIKLAYDIQNAEKYDETTVYYTADDLYRLNTETNTAEKLLDIPAEVQEAEPMGCGCGIAILFMVFGIILTMVGIADETPTLATIGLMLGFISLIAGVLSKKRK